MAFKPYKYIVTAVLLEQDEDGNITGEQATEAVPVYGKTLASVAEAFDTKLQLALEGGGGA